MRYRMLLMDDDYDWGPTSSEEKSAGKYPVEDRIRWHLCVFDENFLGADAGLLGLGPVDGGMDAVSRDCASDCGLEQGQRMDGGGFGRIPQLSRQYP